MAFTPYATVTYTAAANQKVYSVPFPFLVQAHIFCFKNLIPLLDFTLNTAGNTLTIGAGTTVIAGDSIQIRRVTPLATSGQLVDWVGGAAITEAALDTQRLQTVYLAQELRDRTEEVQVALGGVLVGSGNLPSVTGSDDNSGLFVAGGLWAKRTPAEVRTHLALADRAITPFVERWATILCSGTAQNLVSATWYEGSASKILPFGLVSHKDSGGSISIVGSDVQLALPGTYRITLHCTLVNNFGTADSIAAVRVTNEVNSAAQILYLQTATAVLQRTAVGRANSIAFSAPFLLTTTAVNQLISVRANNSVATGNTQLVAPTRIEIERLRD